MEDFDFLLRPKSSIFFIAIFKNDFLEFYREIGFTTFNIVDLLFLKLNLVLFLLSRQSGSQTKF